MYKFINKNAVSIVVIAVIAYTAISIILNASRYSKQMEVIKMDKETSIKFKNYTDSLLKK